MDAEALRSELDKAKARIAQLEEQKSAMAKQQTIMGERQSAMEKQQSAMSAYINQLHDDPFPGDLKDEYRTQFWKTFGRITNRNSGPSIEDLICHEFATKPFDPAWEDGHPLSVRLDVLSTLPSALTHAMEAYVKAIPKFGEWLAVELEAPPNWYDWEEVDSATFRFDEQFWDRFMYWQIQDKGAYVGKADVRVKPIEAVRRLRAELQTKTEDTDALSQVSNTLQDSFRFLRPRHAECTSLTLAKKVCEEKLPDELMLLVYEELKFKFGMPELLECPNRCCNVRDASGYIKSCRVCRGREGQDA